MSEPTSSINVAGASLPQARQGFYVIGGTLPGAALSYVTRQADHQLYEGLCQGQFCYVLTSRQMGKSSLMVRTSARLREAGMETVVLDLTAIGQNLTAEQWYDGLLSRIGIQLHIEDELEDFWLAHPRLGPLQRWMTAIRDIVLPRVPNRLVIFVDEIDTVRSLPFSTDEFFAGIREFYNRRTAEPDLERLTFCLLGVAAPSDLIQDTRTTPFNIGRRIELQDFTREEAAPLAEGLWREGQKGTDLLERVLYWTNGHPYLTQRLCQTLAEYPGAQNVREVDRKCAELFLVEGAQTTDDNLLFVRERIRRSDVDLPGLLTLYEQIYQKRKVPNDEASPFVTTLRLSGLTRVENGQLCVRNRIYERSFNRQWIKDNMPDAELRRQRAAYRRGLLRAGAVATLILAAIGLLAFTTAQGQRQAIRLQKLAEQEKAKADQQRNRAEDEARRADHNAQQLETSLAETEQQRQEAIQQQLLAEEQRRLADEQRNFAEAQRSEAESQREINYRQLYTAQMNLAGQAWEQANIERLNELLDLHLPQPGRADVRGLEWHLLSRLGRTDWPVIRHEDWVTFVSFTPDGKRLVSAGLDGARLHDLATGRELTAFKGHSDRSMAADLSRDGRILATGSNDKTVKIWDVTTGKELHTLNAQFPIIRVSISPDGKTLATVANQRVPIVKLWDVASGRELANLQAHQMPIFDWEFSPDGKLFATASFEGLVKLWEVATGRELFTFGKKHNTRTLPFIKVAFSPDGRRMATNSKESEDVESMFSTRIWDVKTGKELFTLSGNNIPLAFSPDGKKLVTADTANANVHLWDVATGKISVTLKGFGIGFPYVAFSPDGQMLATGSDKITKLWDTNTGQEIATLRGHTKEVTNVTFSPDGQWLATASVDKTARLWDIGRGLNPFTIRGRNSAIAVSPDSRRLAIGSVDGTARLWDVSSGKVILTVKAHSPRNIEDVRFSPDGKILATAGDDNTAKLWDVASGKELVTLKGHTNWVNKIVFTPDGRWVVTSSNDTTHRLWEVATGKELFNFKGHKNYVQTMNISPDGKIVATGSDDGTTKLWDVSSKREITTLTADGARIHAVTFSPDSRILATAGDSNVIRLWDVATWREIKTLKGHSNTIWSLSFSPDGQRLASGSLDSTVKIWDASTGEETLTLREHQGDVKVAFSPDGTFLVTSGMLDQRTKLWRIAKK